MTATTTDSTIRPFKLDIPQADLDDLRDRLDRARWPDELPGDDVDDGVKQAYIRSLADHWRTRFDWRAAEAGINAIPPVHDRDRRPEHPLPPRPVPRAGRAAADRHPRLARLDRRSSSTSSAAHRPAGARRRPGRRLPSGHPVAARLRALRPDARARAGRATGSPAAWVELMRRLGYERYGAVGNDAGSMISPEVGRLDPEHVVGVHVTQIFSFPSGDPAEFAGMSTADDAGARDAPVVLSRTSSRSTS